jgi:glycine/D-amino acid oxidase-like deaminating enzyme
MITAIFHHLLRQHENRFSLEANTAATKITKTPDSEFPYSITTPRGVIKAKHVVHCTEGHSGHLLPLVRGLLVPRRGQITVQNPGSGFPAASSNSWSFIMNNGLDYATQNPSSGQIFIGGGDADKRPLLGISSDAEEDIESLSHLGGILPAVFGVDQWGHELGNKKRIEASWTGILCNSIDSVPFVGMLPQCLLDRPAGTQELGAEWICAGYGGYGMVNAFMSARYLARMIQGTDVRGHLPTPYILTRQRAERLLLILKSVLNSENDHLKALL